VLTYFPEIYPDELLYSVLGRLKCHSGLLSSSRLLDDAFGRRILCARTFLQTNLWQLAANIPPSRGLTAQRLALETTPLPYVTAYQTQEVRDWALAAVTEDNGNANAMSGRLGLLASNVRLPSALRYCPTCRAEMLERHGELYWRRDHQLPGVLVCPIHCAPLADSRVIKALTSERKVIAADEGNCPSSPAPPAWADQPEAVRLLQDIAIASATLLTTPPPARSLAEWCDEVRLALRSRGFSPGGTRIDQPALRDMFLTRFGPILDILPEAVPNNWLANISCKNRQAFAPLHHILIRLLIESLPLVEASNPFGPGPWPCRNSLAEHYGQPVITDCKLHERGGKTIGVFRCSCGYAFSTAPESDSRAKILDLGPLFKKRLRESVTAGIGLYSTARVLHVAPNTVKRYVDVFGLKTPWKALPMRAKLPPIERAAMRAAWTDEHTAAPDLTRSKLTRKIRAVYSWLYRNDRDWLDEQPPVAITSFSKKPRFDWQSIDAATVEILKQEAVHLRVQNPPQQITRSALERALGQRGWLGKRLHKLPLCVIALAELKESVEGFQCRRIVWAAEVLRRQEQPIQVWRLRGLTHLQRNYCSPEVNDFLMKTVSEM
jgi:hypothetical protein